MRTWLRDLIGYESPLYVFAASLITVYFCVIREGLAGFRLLGMRRRAGPARHVKFSRLEFPISVRPGTDDIESVINNIVREEYGRLPKGFTPRTMLDAGAYIGDTAAYFLSRFPDARLVALEPNPESHALAQGNLVEYGNRVVLLQCALWDSVGSVCFAGHDTGAAISDQGFAVATTTVPEILLQLGVERIDLMKMDIEGAEATVLKSGVGGWLRMVDVLLLETHGKAIEDAVMPLLASEGFHMHRHRNVWYCINQQTA